MADLSVPIHIREDIAVAAMRNRDEAVARGVVANRFKIVECVWLEHETVVREWWETRTETASARRSIGTRATVRQRTEPPFVYAVK